MRRRAADFRRPVRRRFPNWIWALLGLFSIAGLFLFVLHHHHNEDRLQKPSLVFYCFFSPDCFVVLESIFASSLMQESGFEQFLFFNLDILFEEFVMNHGNGYGNGKNWLLFGFLL